MSFMKIKISEDFSEVLRKKLAEARPVAAHAVAQQIASDTEPFVPAMTKSLVNRTRVVENTVVYPGPYARFLYNGKLMIDPKTGSAWAPKGATKVVTGEDLNISQAVHSQAQAHWFEASKAQNMEKWAEVAGRAVEKYLDK